ncbi:MAG: 4-hydroxy-tetrahydrodipicolinate reductase [Planctomycetes bacterium]|nr:4-hydroxy-tetrahydrodipicolinate reductase [Planctomycetota bacterium]
MSKLRVLVNGAKGRMGRETARAVRAEGDLELVGEADLGDDLAAAIRSAAAQVVVDFTHPDAAAGNTETILKSGGCPVVGTTGFRMEDIERLQAISQELRRGGLIAPNFAIGAVLLMKFAAEAARFFPDVEVIELHHERKVDAPSGTALKTIEMIRSALDSGGSGNAPAERPREKETVSGARGGRYLGIPVHSIRLPGYVAHQEVQFGAPGQILTLRHDAPSRACFMPGVLFAVRKVVALERLYYGLDAILDL